MMCCAVPGCGPSHLWLMNAETGKPCITFCAACGSSVSKNSAIKKWRIVSFWIVCCQKMCYQKVAQCGILTKSDRVLFASAV